MSAAGPTRVLIVDDHALFREGLAELVMSAPDFTVVGQAADGAEALTKVPELTPDIVLMDLSMPGLKGMEATRFLASTQPGCKVIVLTMRSEQSEVLDAILAGARGYLLKTMRSVSLLECMRRVRDGEMAIASDLTGHLADGFRRLSSQHTGDSTPPSSPSTLTWREQEVLALVCRQKTDKEIARELSISVYTVKAHMRSILAKLSVTSRREAAAYALRQARPPGAEKS